MLSQSGMLALRYPIFVCGSRRIVKLEVRMLSRHDSFRRLVRARELLGEVREHPLSIRDVARDIRMSPFHFIRQFEALFGLTPHQFRIQSRLDNAKELLAKGQHSVTEVCMEVGMSSLGSFSDLFERRVGETPSAYQRRARAMVQVPRTLPAELFPGCLSLMGRLPIAAFRNFREAQGVYVPLESVVVVQGDINENQVNQQHGG
jgi:AraC-like DNA-binding protein